MMVYLLEPTGVWGNSANLPCPVAGSAAVKRREVERETRPTTRKQKAIVMPGPRRASFCRSNLLSLQSFSIRLKVQEESVERLFCLKRGHSRPQSRTLENARNMRAGVPAVAALYNKARNGKPEPCFCSGSVGHWQGAACRPGQRRPGQRHPA